MPNDDRERQVATTKATYGDDHYSIIGSKGGKNSPTKYTSDSGKRAAEIRWTKYRQDKLNEKEREEHGQTQE